MARRRRGRQVSRSLQGEAADDGEEEEGEQVGVPSAPRPVSSPQASGPAPWLQHCLVGAPARYGRQSMGLRGLAGTTHLDGGHADLDATERIATEDAPGVFPSRESGVHQAEEQQQTAGAAAVLQETQPEHERLERPVQVVFQVGRKVR